MFLAGGVLLLLPHTCACENGSYETMERGRIVASANLV